MNTPPTAMTATSTPTMIGPLDEPLPGSSERVAMGVTRSTLVELGAGEDVEVTGGSVGVGVSVTGAETGGTTAGAIVEVVDAPAATVVFGATDRRVEVVGDGAGLPGGDVAGGDVGAGMVGGGFVGGAEPIC